MTLPQWSSLVLWSLCHLSMAMKVEVVQMEVVEVQQVEVVEVILMTSTKMKNLCS